MGLNMNVCYIQISCMIQLNTQIWLVKKHESLPSLGHFISQHLFQCSTPSTWLCFDLFSAQNFFQKFFLTKNFFWLKFLFYQNFCFTKIFFDQNFFDQNFFTKIFLTKNFVWPKIFFDQKFFWPKIFFDQKFGVPPPV